MRLTHALFVSVGVSVSVSVGVWVGVSFGVGVGVGVGVVVAVVVTVCAWVCLGGCSSNRISVYVGSWTAEKIHGYIMCVWIIGFMYSIGTPSEDFIGWHIYHLFTYSYTI